MKYAIEMKDISFSYGQKNILSGFNLQIEEGKVYGFVGSSGSGKTTTLRLMNGLLKPQSGEVKIDGEIFDFSQAEKWRRSMGYSIQGSGLFPHMTLFENLTIIARKEGWEQKKIQDRVNELCELMSLPNDQSFLKKKPREISGGQQQRVGIARALFMKPKIMLMDEPFSALDPITRSELQKEFLVLQEKLGITIILVTHDLPEAFSMSHEMVLLNQGKIEQKGKPSKFLLAPASQYVEEFMDSHSPGNILKEVYLYSVVNSSLYGSIKSGDKIILKHMETMEEKEVSTLEEASAFLQKNDQIAHYWVDSNWKYLGRSDFNGNESKEVIKGKAHILDGMKSLLKSREDTLPVVNDKGQLIGVFSQEALDAL